MALLELLSTVASIETLKLFGAPIYWSYWKKQYEYSAKLNDYNHLREHFTQLHENIEKKCWKISAEDLE